MYIKDLASRFVVKCALWPTSDEKCALLKAYYTNPYIFVRSVFPNTSIILNTMEKLESEFGKQTVLFKWLKIKQHGTTYGVPLRKFSVVLRMMKDMELDGLVDPDNYRRYVLTLPEAASKSKTSGSTQAKIYSMDGI